MLIDATLLHIEEGCVVELTHGAAMRALHIVGIDFQHGLGVHMCLSGHTEILVHLFGSGLLCIMSHQHLACESPHSLFIEHIFVELMAVTMRHSMVDERIVVNLLRRVGNDTAIAPALCSLTLESEVQHVARNAIMKCYHVMIDTAGSLLLNVDITHTGVLEMGFFQAIEVETCILAYISFYDLSGEETAVVGRRRILMT